MNTLRTFATHTAVITWMYALAIAYVLLVGAFLNGVAGVLERSRRRRRTARVAVAEMHLAVGDLGDSDAADGEDRSCLECGPAASMAAYSGSDL